MVIVSDDQFVRLTLCNKVEEKKMPNPESKNGSSIQEIDDQKIPKRENDWLKVLFHIYVNSVSLYGFYVVFFEARLLTSLFSKYLIIRYYCTKSVYERAQTLLLRDTGC